MGLVLRLAILITLVSAGAARAERCPPSARLSGEAKLVEGVARELAARGIATEGEAACPSVRARIAARAGQLVVMIEGPDGAAGDERLVNEVSAAATVIESFARTDVALPLLAARSTPTRSTPPAVMATRSEAPVASAAPRVHVALGASVESSRASDGTTWLGANAKICIELGAVCAAARYRASKVVAGFDATDIAREHSELLIGVDVPIALGGRLRLVPGFAGGVGRMETRIAGAKQSTGGFVAEGHVSLSRPIVHALAIEVSLGAVLGDYERASAMAPAEPPVSVRAGVGLRYEL